MPRSKFPTTCPHCYENQGTVLGLSQHLRFDCPKLVGRTRYQPPVVENPYAPYLPVLGPQQREKFFAEIEDFLLTAEP